MSRDLFVVTSGCCALMLTSGCGHTDGGQTGVAATAISVVTVTAEAGSLERTTTQPATVHPFYESRILAKTSGYLTKLHVDIGSRVQAGEVLAEIDVPEMVKQYERLEAELASLIAAVSRAEAEVTVAAAGRTAADSSLNQSQADEQGTVAQLKADESEYNRVTELVNQRALADRLLDESLKRFDASRAAKQSAEAITAFAAANVEVASARVTAAEADLAMAEAEVDVGRKRLEELRAMLDYTQLRAPLNGIVLERRVDLGDLVHNAQNNNPGEALFVVAQLDPVRVRVAVPERDAPWASVGDQATITLQALPNQQFTGAVARISGGLSETTRTMLVEIDLPNSDGRLLPGMFGQATIELDIQSDRVTLPASAVRYDEKGRSYVYVIDAQNEVQTLDVETGVDDGHQIEITSGLGGGEQVVGPLVRRLKTGDKVSVQ